MDQIVRTEATEIATVHMTRIKAPSDAQPDEIVEVQPTRPVIVSQTNTLYRIVPAANDTKRFRQIAVVAAESEAQARSLATTHDPFGRDWKNEALFTCQVEHVAEPNVVGDVMFKSIPLVTRPKALRAEK